MTRDEILNMPAGKEMDILVGEQVMGEHLFGFAPSTRIEHAWKVVEKMRSSDKLLRLTCEEDGKVWCSFKYSVTADTAPLAICRAALLVLIGENE